MQRLSLLNQRKLHEERVLLRKVGGHLDGLCFLLCVTWVMDEVNFLLSCFIINHFRRNPSGDASAVGDSTESELDGEERLTKEEWHAINKILSYQVDEDTTLLGKDMQHMMLFLVDVSVNQAAARIIDINQTEIVCGRFEQLHVTTKLYHKSIHCDVSLKFYGLMSPEGPLARVCFNLRCLWLPACLFLHLFLFGTFVSEC